MEPKIKQVDSMAANRTDNGFYGQDIISVSQFDRTKLDYIFNVADEMKVLVERFGSAVFKPLYTSKARGMEVIDDGPDALARIADFQATNPVMYIQQKIDIPGRDLGLVFLGGRYLTTYARCSTDANAWNTTTASGGKYAPAQPEPELIELARRAQALFGLDFTCVDIVETTQGPLVFEVSAFGGFRGILEACGMDAAGLYADYVLEKIRAHPTTHR
jgi:ribosomal protein S6--L-glutamate ligase